MNKLDFKPLVNKLIDKTNEGKIKWEPTADRKAFIASIGGDTSYKIQLETVQDFDYSGNIEYIDIPRLDMIDQQGHLLWNINNSDVPDGLKTLYYIARRIGNQLDERIEKSISSLEEI